MLRKVDFGESLNEFQEVHLESDFVRVVADVKARNGRFAQSHLLVGNFLIDLKRGRDKRGRNLNFRSNKEKEL